MAAIWPAMCPTPLSPICLHSTVKSMFSFFCCVSCTLLGNLTYVFQKKNKGSKSSNCSRKQKVEEGLRCAGFFWTELEYALSCYTLLKLLLVACWDPEKEKDFFCWCLRSTPRALSLLLDSLHNCTSQLLLIKSLSPSPQFDRETDR